VYSIIKSIKPSEYNELKIKLLKEFSENANKKVFMNHNNNIHFTDSEEMVAKFYGLNEMWNLMLDSSPLTPELCSIVLDDLMQQLSNLNCFRYVKKTLLNNCFLLIKSGNSVYQAFIIAFFILNRMYSDIPQDHPSSLMSVYKELDGKYSIIALIIDEIVKYRNKIIQFSLINKSQNI